MSDSKKLVGRGGMQIAPGNNAPLGYWPENLDRADGTWAGQGRNIYRQALQIGQRYHDNNHAIAVAGSNGPVPDLGDPLTRHQLARADLQRLTALVDKMGEIEKQ